MEITEGRYFSSSDFISYNFLTSDLQSMKEGQEKYVFCAYCRGKNSQMTKNVIAMN